MGYVCKILVLIYFVFLSADLHSQTWRRFYWIQVEKADNHGDIAVANSNLDGEWNAGLNYSGGQFTAGNFVFNTDQSLTGADNYVLTYDQVTGEIGLEPSATGGGFSSFDLQADAGFNETIGDGDVMILTGGTGIDTETSNPDEVIFNLDFSELAVELAVDDAVDYFVLWDSGSGAEEIATENTVEEWVEDNIGQQMITGTQSLITVSYTDGGLAAGVLNFVVEPNLSQYTNDAGFITGEVDGSTINEAWTIDADDADTELITTQTVKFEGSGIVSTNYVPGTNTLIISASEVDGSTINETWWIAGDTGSETGISADDGYITFAGSGIVSTAYNSTTNTLTISASEVDGSTTNESWSIAGDTGSETGITQADGTITFAGGTNVTTSYNSTTNTLTINSSSSGMTSFSLAGDSGTPQTISNGNTLTVATNSLNGFSSSTGSTDRVTISLQPGLFEWDDAPLRTGILDYFLWYDVSTGMIDRIRTTEMVMADEETVGAIIFDNRSSPTSSVQGSAWYDTVTDRLFLYTGAGWQTMVYESDFDGGTDVVTTNVDGWATVSHSLGSVPSIIVGTGDAYDMNVSIYTANSSTITFVVEHLDGTAYNSETIALYWFAKK